MPSAVQQLLTLLKASGLPLGTVIRVCAASIVVPVCAAFGAIVIVYGVRAIQSGELVAALSYVGLYAVVSIFTPFVMYYSDTTVTKAHNSVTARLTPHLFNHILQLPVATVKAAVRDGWIYRRLSESLSLGPTAVGVVLQSVSEAVRLFGYLLVIAIVSPYLISLVPLLLVMMTYFAFRYVRSMTAVDEHVMDCHGRLINSLFYPVGSIRAVKAYAQESSVFNAAQKILSDLAEAQLRHTATLAYLNILFKSAAGIARASIVGVVIWVSFSGNIDIARAIAGGVLCMQALEPLDRLARNLASWSKQSVLATRFFEVLEIREEKSGETHFPTLVSPPEIRLHRVSVIYGEKLVLEEVSLNIKPGSRVAVVGRSGAGKSTLLSVIGGLVAPSEGTVQVCGNDVYRHDVRSYRQQVGFVLQEAIPYCESVAEELSHMEHHHTVTRCVRNEIIEDLGLTRRLLSGERILAYADELSGGERQRILIARMLMMQPHFALLDEPSSSLDAQTESLVMRALDKWLPYATRVTVAHRAETIQQADVVIVMHEGQVVDCGPPAEVSAASAHFHNMIYGLRS